ncbi:hypothetical protein D3C72_492910 [compost metagenome]
MHVDARTQVHALVFFGLVAGDDDARHVLAAQLLADLRYRDRSVDRLPARHRDRVVEEDLVGDVGARGHRLAYGQVAGVVVGAFPHVLEDVRHAGVARQADPVDAFAAHLRQAARVAVHPGCHVVAAHAGQRLAALGHLGRRAVRTARTEIGTAAHAVGIVGQRRLAFECRQVRTQRQAGGARQPSGQRLGQQRRAQLPGRGHQRFAIKALLADDRRALGQIEQQVLDLAFDHGAFFFHHQNVRQPARKLKQPLAIQRPGQAGLVDAHRCVGCDGVHAQARQRFHGVQVRLADRDDAHGRLGRGTGQAVDAVAARERGNRFHAQVHARFDGQRQEVTRGIFQRFGRHVGVGRHVVVLHGGRRERVAAFDGFGHRLERDPGAGIARQRPAPQRERFVLVDRGRMHDRHLPTDQRRFAGVRNG